MTPNDARLDYPGLIEAMAANTEMAYDRGDLSVGWNAGWFLVSFDAEGAVRTYLDEQGHEAMGNLFNLIADAQGEITKLFLKVDSSTGYDTLTDMHGLMIAKFSKALAHEYDCLRKEIEDEAVRLHIKNQEQAA